MNPTTFDVITPVDGSVLLTQTYSTPAQMQAALAAAQTAQKAWRNTPLAQRVALVSRAVDWLVAQKDAIALSIAQQIGRPIAQCAGEVRGLEERSRYMLSIAEQGMADIQPEPKEGFTRFLRREPLGTVVILPPWNYPFLTTVNTLMPALAAGNTVILKHSSQTPLVAKFFDDAFQAAGLPSGVFQTLFLDHDATTALIQASQVDFVAFTGSVAGGHKVVQAAADRFIGMGLELGGKDPAYVCDDADLASAVENLVDGAFFNSGQSCCGIERIYVHASLYDAFVAQFVALTKQYKLGNPLDASTNLGPVVRASAAEFIKGQINEAVAAGAVAHIDSAHFGVPNDGAYLSPQVLTNVNHSMRVMREESFGPVIGIMSVASDDEAIALMNDSDYGLTASIWTRDMARAERIANQVETGTVFMNRCDYLDPALAWTGVKDTGRGVSLSILGYAQLTRVKSFHLKG
ncbi:MAG: aldehyde dehydrogenase family protein [Formosimonas sp.]